jgi:hypothetical protein
VVVYPGQHPREFSRRWLELSAFGAGAARDCAAACDDVDPLGFAAGFTALLRPSREYAVGAGWDRAWFRWRPEGDDSATAHLTSLRLLARLYLIAMARLDFWLEASVNESSEGASRRVLTPPSSIGTGTGAGLDVFVWDHLKLGPRAQVNLVFAPRAPQEGGQSVGAAVPPPEAPPIRLVLQLGLAVTVPFGPALRSAGGPIR